MKAMTVFSAAMIAAGLTAATAMANANDGGEWMAISQLASKLEASGYTVKEIERDDGRYEVEMFDQNGVKFEAKIHRSTGEILKKERED